MMMKIAAFLFRLVLALAVIIITGPVARLFADVKVTAPGLVVVLGLFIAARLVLIGAVRFTRPDPVALSAAADVPMARARALGEVRSAELRARHEAAHAVVAHALGHRVLVATIVTDGDSGGRVTWRHKDPSMALASIDHVTVAFAGPLAEQTGDVVSAAQGGADDYSAMMRTSIAASITDPLRRSPGEILDAGTKEARRLIRLHPRAIDALAAELLSTEGRRDLDEDEIRGLMQLHRVHHSKEPDED